MKEVTFITGNQDKADYLAKYLGHPVKHRKLDLDEIQSLDLQTVVEHKVHQAYDLIRQPVIVEDVSLEFHALGKLPGTLIRWFIDELGFEGLCRLVADDRRATARCVFGYYDGKVEHYFESSLSGLIAKKPAGTDGFGWDPIFIPEGYTVTRAELSEEDDRITYLKIKPFADLKEFLDA